MPGVYVNIHEAPSNCSDRITVEERARAAQTTKMTGSMIYSVLKLVLCTRGSQRSLDSPVRKRLILYTAGHKRCKI
jgi:hypothetical protein